MPRTFDSDQPPPGGLTFVETVECVCGQEFEGLFTAHADAVAEIDAPPVAEHTCPACRHVFVTTFTGWTLYTEAG